MPPKRPAASMSPDMPNGTGNPTDGDEFTRVVRKRLSTSTRTGQACDRCKVRKIRCDGLPGGCSPCIQNHSECKTTDRISQKAVPRGHLENLERRCEELEAKNKELQAALATIELESRTNVGYGHLQSQEQWATNGTPSSQYRSSNIFGERWRPSEHNTFGLIGGGAPNTRVSSFRPGNANTHYLGMSSGNSYLSSMKAQALSVLGIDIDLAVLDPGAGESAGRTNPSDTDETYGSCLATIFNVNPNVKKTDLPPKEEGLRWINYFFMISHPYLPIIHKPSFLSMVERIYLDKTFEPTAAQMVSIHMVLAIVHWQNATQERMQNHGQTGSTAKELFERSRVHFHYAISLVYELLSRPSLEDLQAIGLILQHMRSFPKPGGSWLLSRMAMSMCVELGLHRSAKKWIYGGDSSPNFIELEMRKRVFWCILALEVSLASKLGRPMTLREGGYDAEYPERVDDEFITANGILKRSDSEDCSFDIAIEMFKHTNITIQIHDTLYGAARPSRDKYVSLVEDLEAKLVKWRDGNPASLSLESTKLERRFQAAHLHSWFHEARILLRHPSLSLSPSPSFTKDCLRICVESSRSILHLTDNLRKGNHYLDTTWYGATVQLLATLTILFSVWDKRENVTPEEIAQVKTDMDLCMDIMGDLGSLLGSPDRLREVVRVLTQGTMDLLDRKPEKSGASPPLQSRIPSGNSLPPFSNGGNSYTPATSGPVVPTLKVPSGNQPLNEIYPPPATYKPEVRSSTSIPVYGDSLIPSGDVVYDAIQAPANATTTPLYNSGFSPTAAPTPAAHYQQASENNQQNGMFWGWSGDESWRRYMQNISSIAGDLDPNETFSASALIALNQDCNNGIYNPNGNSPQPGGAIQPGLGAITPSVGPASSHGTVAPHSGFRPESADQSWSVTMGYSFPDSPVRIMSTQSTDDTPEGQP